MLVVSYLVSVMFNPHTLSAGEQHVDSASPVCRTSARIQPAKQWRWCLLFFLPNRVLVSPSFRARYQKQPNFLLTFWQEPAFAGMSESMPGDLDTQFVAQLTASQLPLLLYVRSLLPGESAAGDVAQQANAKIWEKRAEFELGTNFKAWAFSIARYEVLNYRKQQARDAKLFFSPELDRTITQELAEARDDLPERHEALKACLEQLRPQDRDLLFHRYSSAGTLADFAVAVSRSVGSLKVTLHRLRTALLTCIERRLQSEEATS